MKDKYGKDVTMTEFLQRWKAGMKAITPYQMSKTTHRGYIIISLGIIAGIVTSAMTKVWWLVILLSGSLIINFIGALGNWQKMQMLKQFEIPIQEEAETKEDTK